MITIELHGFGAQGERARSRIVTALLGQLDLDFEKIVVVDCRTTAETLMGKKTQFLRVYSSSTQLAEVLKFLEPLNYDIQFGTSLNFISKKLHPAVMARMQGYETEPCKECKNYTVVRNGTCHKCNTCGATWGCD
jgi:hypothetical protein